MGDTTSALLIAFHDELLSSVTPTANFTPATGDFGLANLKDARLLHRCRTPDLTTDRQLTWDLGSAKTFNVFALMGANATLSATRRFRAADNSGFSAGVIESGSSLTAAFDTSLGSLLVTAPAWGRTLIYVHSTTVSKQFVRWHQSDATNPDGYQEWGIARIGEGWQPGRTFKIVWRSADRWIGPPGAQHVLRGHELTLWTLTRAEAYKLATLYRGALGTRRLLVIPEPLAPETWLSDALWCVLEEAYVREPREGSSPTNRLYQVTLTFREVDE